MPAAPLLIGHRGAPGYRPEHSAASYELAFTQGVDLVEPDVVFTRDRVPVVRHENEIGSTTDVASRPEFADRRTTKRVDGVSYEGWFTEDFTWEELATLGTRERLPHLRPRSAAHDGEQPVLRLLDVLRLAADASRAEGREIGVVVEIKHATYFQSLGVDVVGTIDEELRAAGWAETGLPLVFESFELAVLRTLREREIPGRRVFLARGMAKPFDLVAAHGRAAPSYTALLKPAGLDDLAQIVDGISLDKRLILQPTPVGRARMSPTVDAAHERGLDVFTWTCRPENAFLIGEFRRGGGKAAFGDYEAEWRLLARAGVDGVFVDHPDLGIEVFRGGTDE